MMYAMQHVSATHFWQRVWVKWACASWYYAFPVICWLYNKPHFCRCEHAAIMSTQLTYDTQRVVKILIMIAPPNPRMFKQKYKLPLKKTGKLWNPHDPWKYLNELLPAKWIFFPITILVCTGGISIHYLVSQFWQFCTVLSISNPPAVQSPVPSKDEINTSP